MSYDKNVHQIKIPTDLTEGEINRVIVIFTFPFDESVIQLNGAWVDGHIQFTLPEILRTQRGDFYIEVNIDLTDSQITFARYRAKVVKSDIDANTNHVASVYFELFEDFVNEVANNAQQAKDAIDAQTTGVESHANTSKQSMDSDVNIVHDYGVSAKTAIDAKVVSVELAKNQALSDIADKQQDVTDASTQFIADLADTQSTIDAQVTQAQDSLQEVSDTLTAVNDKMATVNDTADVFMADVADKSQLVDDKYQQFDDNVTEANGSLTEILAAVKNVDVKIKNEVVNGDFSSGTTNWYVTNGTIVSQNNTLLNTGNDQTAISQVYNITGKLNGQKQYIKFRVRVTNDFCTKISVAQNGIEYTAIANPVKDMWYACSFLNTMINTGANNTNVVRQTYVDASTANGKIMELQYVAVINLTETFGIDNEPTKTEMDELIKVLGGWFDVEITLTQKQQLTWVLNLIRKNALAVTALGGTIL